MKKLTLAAVLAATLSAGALTAVATPAQAQAFSFSFNTGDVAFAYSDGYWDRSHRWHSWRDAREAREFRNQYGHMYNDTSHTRVRNEGWRDEDRDGIPNAVDRDRDGDGIPNRYDRRPDSPQAQRFSFSFNTGDVAFAYSDGYWDRSHRWHSWRNAREARAFRDAYGHMYNNSRHTRVRNQGWRDEDHDGIPNAVDRDRDGDGIPNRYDRRPDNARRP